MRRSRGKKKRGKVWKQFNIADSYGEGEEMVGGEFREIGEELHVLSPTESELDFERATKELQAEMWCGQIHILESLLAVLWQLDS